MGVDISQTSEQIARRIADAGRGVYPVSKVREAIYETALVEVRKLKHFEKATLEDERVHWDD